MNRTARGYFDGCGYVDRMVAPWEEVETVQLDVSTEGSVTVGPMGLERNIPKSARVVVTGQPPYDLELELEYDKGEARLVLDRIRILRRPLGVPVRTAELQQVRIPELIALSLRGEVLDDRGWPGLIQDHPDHDQVAVDALVYSLAHALADPRPTQTVATARGLKPGSGIKRVMKAREQGYLGAAQRGRSAI